MTDEADRDISVPTGLDAVLRRMIAAREEALGAAMEHSAARNRRIEELDAMVAAATTALEDTRASLAEAHRRLVAEAAHIGDRNRRIGELDADIAARDRRIGELETELAQLRRLAEELVWPEGPRALRAALPVARLLRQIIRR